MRLKLRGTVKQQFYALVRQARDLLLEAAGGDPVQALGLLSVLMRSGATRHPPVTLVPANHPRKENSNE